MAGWSNGHNTWLSPQQPGFDSPCRRIFVLFFYTYFQSSAQPPDILTFNTVCFTEVQSIVEDSKVPSLYNWPSVAER